MQYPLSINEITPHPDAIRKPSIHTGGVYLWNQEAWKPLDCLPFPNAEFRCNTNEAEALEAAAQANIPLFPRNWRVEELNGRRWLVRPICKIVGQDLPTTVLAKPKELERIKTGLMAFNALGWEVGDFDLQFAWHKTCGLFALDLSCAMQIPVGNSMYGDEGRYQKLLSRSEKEDEAYLNARSKLADMALIRRVWYNYIYQSPRPVLGHQWGADWNDKQMAAAGDPGYHWLLSKHRLDDAVVAKYELKLIYERWYPIYKD